MGGFRPSRRGQALHTVAVVTCPRSYTLPHYRGIEVRAQDAAFRAGDHGSPGWHGLGAPGPLVGDGRCSCSDVSAWFVSPRAMYQVFLYPSALRSVRVFGVLGLAR